MKKLIANNALFYFSYLVFLLAGTIVLLLVSKGEEILFVNSNYNAVLNVFFYYTTKLAEGPAFVMMLLVILFGGYGNGLLTFIAYSAVGLFVQLLKHFVFDDSMRPAAYFTNKMQLHFIDGLQVLRYNSFPSGHTAIAFALFLSLAIITKNKKWGILYFILALAVGLSRVYLMQHFFVDVFFGSLVSVIITSLVWQYIPQTKFFMNLNWKDKKAFIND